MTKMVSIRIDASLLSEVDEIRRGEGRARSDCFREAVEAWVRDRRTAELVREHGEGYARKPVSEKEFDFVLGAQVWPK